MKNSIIFVVIAVILFFAGCNSYNGMVGTSEGINKAWANVESQYQRRADLIPNLVATVEGVKDFEKSTLTAVIEARSQATQMKIDPTNLTPERMAEFEKAQSQLSGSLSRLLVVSEQYPTLQATQQFRDLAVELSSTENKITIARNDFNKVVEPYNAKISKFPTVIFAKMFGFGRREYFKSNPGSQEVPKVKFN